MARFLAPLEMTRGAVRPWNDEHCTVLASVARHPYMATELTLRWQPSCVGAFPVSERVQT
ncbi:hypothetical protein Cagg_0184 [Chloroflexus aggregans DSM 9485]|uniref:Uncharacterized protein n=1 Tax=Chloroflexus aggregans (strain MD-66 / DSM 9485) TaxID=326427 RepID=B8GCT5_CHLAD|nr:hypothetical protein Cagg_0184 [Chloroflexus aggregans DSM 9485]